MRDVSAEVVKFVYTLAEWRETSSGSVVPFPSPDAYLISKRGKSLLAPVYLAAGFREVASPARRSRGRGCKLEPFECSLETGAELGKESQRNS